MKINHVCRQNDGTPNKLFLWMGSLLNTLLEQRRRYHPDTYVTVPEPEKDIVDFTTGMTRGAIGLLIGPVGIGKSTLLAHFQKTVWNSPENKCEVVALDCSRHNFSQKLGIDFHSKSLEARRSIASTAAHSILCLEFRNYFAPQYDYRERDLFNFIRTHQRGLLVGSASPISDDATISRLLEQAEREDAVSYWSCVIVFCVSENQRDHVKLIIDNVDDKDAVLVAQFVEEVAHFQQKINEIAERAELSKFRFTPILSCRPTTLHRVHLVVDADPEHVGQGWAGVHEILFRKPCAISEALIKRYYQDASDLKLAGRIKLREKVQLIFERDFEDKPKYWTVDTDKLFIELVKILDDTEQLDHILALSNYNVAEAMTMTLKMLSNNRFIPVKALAEQTKETLEGVQSSPREFFSRTTAIRTLAYGNQHSKFPVYPVCDTPIHNLMDGPGGQRDLCSLIKFRILAILNHSGNLASIGYNGYETVSRKSLQSILCPVLHKESDVVEAINSLFNHMLLAPREVNANPSEIDDDHAIVLLPRGEFLLRQLELDSVLLECWRDNITLPEVFRFNSTEYLFSAQGSRSLLTYDLAMEVAALVALVAKTEFIELGAMENKARKQFREVSGIPIFQRMLTGLRSSLNRHYNRRLSENEKQAVQVRLEKIFQWSQTDEAQRIFF